MVRTYSYNSSIQSSFKFYDSDLLNGHFSGNGSIYRTKSSPVCTPDNDNLVVNGSANGLQVRKAIPAVTIVFPGSIADKEAMNDARPPPESPSTSDQSSKVESPKIIKNRQRSSRVNSVAKNFRRPQPSEQQGRTTPYWLRGNPQPLTGVRGCPMYNAAFGVTVKPVTKPSFRRPAPESRSGYQTGKEERLKTNGTLYKVTKYRSVSEYCLKSTATQTAEPDTPNPVPCSSSSAQPRILKYDIMPNCPPPPPTIQIRQKLNNIEEPKYITRHLHGSMNSLNSLPNPAPLSPCSNINRPMEGSGSAWDLGTNSNKPCGFLDCFGRGGAGAPIRDRYGRLVADRSALRQSWHTMLDTNLPHSLSNSLNLSDHNGYNDLNKDGSESGTVTTDHNGNYVGERDVYSGIDNGPPAPMLDQRQAYKMELKHQIEEKKRLQTLAMQEERERDAREQASNREYLERQKRELEEEKRREMKRYGRTTQEWDVPAKAKHDTETKTVKREVKEDKHDELEWWEKKPPMSLNSNGRISRAVRNVAQVAPTRSSTSADQLYVGRPPSKVGAESMTSYGQSPSTPAPIRSPTLDEAESFAPLGYDRRSNASKMSIRSQRVAAMPKKGQFND